MRRWTLNCTLDQHCSARTSWFEKFSTCFHAVHVLASRCSPNLHSELNLLGPILYEFDRREIQPILQMDQFCAKCESILVNGPVCECGNRNTTTDSASTTRVWFNKRKELLKPDDEANKESQGPKVEKYCNRCNALTLQTYFTAQLRSADEGQTVFYRCTKCMIQTSENS